MSVILVPPGRCGPRAEGWVTSLGFPGTDHRSLIRTANPRVRRRRATVPADADQHCAGCAVGWDGSTRLKHRFRGSNKMTPGYTASACLKGPYSGVGSSPTIQTLELEGRLSPQSCAIDMMAICSFWLQSCFYGGCWAARAFGGSKACSTCMTGCLFGSPCANCVNPGPCMYASPAISGGAPCIYNICA
jgi:hypothetical protein